MPGTRSPRAAVAQSCAQSHGEASYLPPDGEEWWCSEWSWDKILLPLTSNDLTNVSVQPLITVSSGRGCAFAMCSSAAAAAAPAWMRLCARVDAWNSVRRERAVRRAGVPTAHTPPRRGREGPRPLRGVVQRGGPRGEYTAPPDRPYLIGPFPEITDRPGYSHFSVEKCKGNNMKIVVRAREVKY